MSIIDFAEPKFVKRGSTIDVVHGDDTGLFVEFFYKPIEDKGKTEELGRPIYNDVEYVRIIPMGDKTTKVERRAKANDKKRFAKQYEAFSAQEDQKILGGTPLKEWPLMSTSKIKEMNMIGVFTVEKFTELDDRTLSNSPGLRELQKKAKEFLGGQDRVGELEKEIAEMKKLLAEKSAPKKKKESK